MVVDHYSVSKFLGPQSYIGQVPTQMAQYYFTCNMAPVTPVVLYMADVENTKDKSKSCRYVLIFKT